MRDKGSEPQIHPWHVRDVGKTMENVSKVHSSALSTMRKIECVTVGFDELKNATAFDHVSHIKFLFCSRKFLNDSEPTVRLRVSHGYVSNVDVAV